MYETLLLTGPGVVDIVRDLLLIIFIVFAFFALIVFLVMSLLLYRRVSDLLGSLTAAVQRGDRILQDVGVMTGAVRRGGAVPGVAFRGVAALASSLIGGMFRRRRGSGEKDEN